MILYHGSNTEIMEIDLSKCRPYKDFGSGFYLTAFKEQAVRMAKNRAALSIQFQRWTEGINALLSAMTVKAKTA